jgi:hypothetical protein
MVWKGGLETILRRWYQFLAPNRERSFQEVCRIEMPATPHAVSATLADCEAIVV